MAAVRFDYRAADRQPEAHAALRALGARAVELLEQALLLSLRYAGTTVRYPQRDVRRRGFRPNFEGRAAGGVLERVLDQIDEHLLDHCRVELDQRQSGREAHHDRAVPEPALQPRDHAA